jgi:hypothetical protein
MYSNSRPISINKLWAFRFDKTWRLNRTAWRNFHIHVGKYTSKRAFTRNITHKLTSFIASSVDASVNPFSKRNFK